MRKLQVTIDAPLAAVIGVDLSMVLRIVVKEGYEGLKFVLHRIEDHPVEVEGKSAGGGEIVDHQHG